MSFVQLGFLFALSTLAIPVLIHLLNRWQVRQLDLGTMRFLQEIIRDGAQRRKLRRWFLLLTRMVLVSILTLLFARPFFAKMIRNDGERLRIILIDRSASMSMPGKNGRLVDDAVAEAARAAEDFEQDGKVVWAWFDHQVEPIAPEIARPVAPRNLAGDTNYLAALTWARDRANSIDNAVVDLVLVTDMQQSGMSREELLQGELQFPQDVPVTIVDVGRAAPNNLAITQLLTSSHYIDGSFSVRAKVSLFNFGASSFEQANLSAIAINGNRNVKTKQTIDVGSAQASDVTLDFGKLTPGIWQITAAVDVEDDLIIDNRRWTAIEIIEPKRVIILEADANRKSVQSSSRFLQAALVQRNESTISADVEGVSRPERFRCETISLARSAAIELTPSSNVLVTVADAGAIDGDKIDQLARYVNEGGQLLVFAGPIASSNWKAWQSSGLSCGEISSPLSSGAMPFRMYYAESTNAMLQPFADPQHGDLSRLTFQQILPVKPSANTQVLALFDRKHPAITQHSYGKGRVVWFLSSVDSTWSNWTNSPLYLPLVQQMAAELLNLTGEGNVHLRMIGDLAGTDQQPLGQPGFQDRDGQLYVVNTPTQESDLTRVDAERFAEHYSLKLSDAIDEGPSPQKHSESRHELWPWLAAALFVLLFVEFSLSNRTLA